MAQVKYAAFMAGVLVPPVFLILEQPDLSTAVIIVWIFVCMLFMGDLDYKSLSGHYCWRHQSLSWGCSLSRIPTRNYSMIISTAGLWLGCHPRNGRRIPISRETLSWQSVLVWGGLWGKGLNNDNPLSVKNGNSFGMIIIL